MPDLGHYRFELIDNKTLSFLALPTENHILKQMPFEASLLQQMRERFPTVERVAVPPSGGTQFYVVFSMVDGVPAGPLDPSVDESLPNNQQLGSALGIDATSTPTGPPSRSRATCAAPPSPSRGRKFLEVADIPGWRDYDFP